MENKTNISYNNSHSISIENRKKFSVTGVTKIDSFDNEEFLIDTSMGYIIIKGEDLEIIKLDTYQGTVSLKGLINSFSYIDENKSLKKEDSFISKLFK